MEPMAFVLFGATGDLARRKLFPALYRLFLDQKLPQEMIVVGTGKGEKTDEQFRAHVHDSLETFSKQVDELDPNFDDFLEMFHYCALDARNGDDYKKLLELVQHHEREYGIPENRLFYLSVSPEFFDTIALHIKEAGLGDTKGWKRLIIEKPFGRDLDTARLLNEKLNQAFDEKEIYRIDHYLGKGMVQNLRMLRFGNSIFEPLWNKEHIANVQITATEVVGVEGRADYYEKSGALRDMFQNHLLQLFMLVAMEPEELAREEDVHEKKKNVLASLRPIQKEDAAKHIIFGQYGRGETDGHKVIGYRQEPGVDPLSKTDTFIAARLYVDNARWSGVPFYIQTGKRMNMKSTKIIIEFKRSADEKDAGFPPNLLEISIGPDTAVSFRINSNDLEREDRVEQVNMKYKERSKHVQEAYERLLFDAFKGNSTFFARWGEVEAAWKFVQPLLDSMAEDLSLYEYPAGSRGPKASRQLLQEDGFRWW
ncbi:glucose-6-phosphate dehydrogenase [Priestia abyssalis]|uniref:glucose-6-phosphate dehydrogenase n=1 Tax=Priestia abyssalis TaxID=1221450 RepID=UPI000994ED95|nr:glucose-6-phosphate dehydrogenase [Priestia abyssalis]